MTDLIFTAMQKEEADGFRTGACDAYGNLPAKPCLPAACPAGAREIRPQQLLSVPYRYSGITRATQY